MASNLITRKPAITKERSEIPDLLLYANQNRNKGFLNDVTVRINEDEIYANRLVLCCFSPFFEQMMKEKRDKRTFDLEDVDAHSVASVIDFIYCGRIDIASDTVMKLLETADKLQVEELRRFCLEFLETSMDKDSCFDAIRASDKYQSEGLKNTAYSHITDNFDKINKCDNFKELSKEDLLSCFSYIKRNKVEEKAVYDAIINWVKHDEERRAEDLTELFRALKLEELPLDFLTNVVSKEPIVQKNVVALNMVMNRMSEILKESKRRDGGCKIISTGGYKTALMCAEVYNMFNERPVAYPILPRKVKNHCTVMSDKVIYLIGGEVFEGNSVSISNQLWHLKLKSPNLKWEPLPPMKERRRGMSAAVFGDCIVVAGGGDGNRLIKAVEVFQKTAKQWKDMTPLNHLRSGNALVTSGSYVYAVGGADSNIPLKSVERLSDVTGRWSDMAPMSIGRSWLAAVSYKDCIYAFGGQSGSDLTTNLRSGEKYNPHENRWSRISDMKFTRSAHSACVLENKIYVVGGLDSAGNVVKIIECYDPQTDTWSEVGTTRCELFNHSVVTI